MNRKVIMTAAAAVILSGGAALLLCLNEPPLVLSTDTKESKTPKADNSRDQEELRKLQQELVSTLGKAVELLKAELEVGTVPYTEVLVAQAQLFDARLDMAATVDEQIAVLEKLVELQREVDREVKIRVEVGTCKPSTQRIVQSHRLKAEIALAKLKATQK